MNTPIQASDSIVLPHPAMRVWSVLADFGAYRQWWPKSVDVQVRSSGTDLLGTEVELRPAGGRPFRCRVEGVEAVQRIQMRYGGGFIEGTGTWLLEPEGDATRVRYVLDVQARGWLVALLGKVFNLSRIHSRFMQTILKNLADTLAKEHGIARSDPS